MEPDEQGAGRGDGVQGAPGSGDRAARAAARGEASTWQPGPVEIAPEPSEAEAVASPLEQFIRLTLRQVRRLAVLLVGLTVVLVGLVMLVTPGPALVVVPLGLAILAIEFAWARRLLHQVRDRAARARADYWDRRG